MTPPRETISPACRLDKVTSTIFAEMSMLATKTGAVNLGQGFPDTEGPASVAQAAIDAIASGRNQYAPGRGVPELITAIIGHQQRWYDIELTPEQVVVTTGATEAIAAALLGLVDPGDEVVVLEPYYDSYRAMIQFAGGVRRPVTLRAPDFRLDLDELAVAITDRTKLILLNSPHNPTGTVLTREELEGVARIAVERDLMVVTDEVYEHLTFDCEHIPLATLPGMAERTLTLSSAGKSYSFTGWKVGWATGPAPMVAALTGAKNWLTFTSGSPLQPAIAHALTQEADFPRHLGDALRQQRDLMVAGLRSIDGLEVFVPDGTYFALTDVRSLGHESGEAFCRFLPEHAGVVAIPAQCFYDDLEEGRHLVRWAFCKQPDVINEGIARLAAADLRGPR